MTHRALTALATICKSPPTACKARLVVIWGIVWVGATVLARPRHQLQQASEKFIKKYLDPVVVRAILSRPGLIAEKTSDIAGALDCRLYFNQVFHL